MPPHAEVFVIQDDPHRIESILYALRSGNHTLFEGRVAETLADVDDILANVGDRRPDVCLVDKNFPYNSGDHAEPLGQTATQKIINTWQNNTPPVIAYTIDESPGFGDMHFNPTKQSTPTELAPFINSL